MKTSVSRAIRAQITIHLLTPANHFSARNEHSYRATCVQLAVNFARLAVHKILALLAIVILRYNKMGLVSLVRRTNILQAQVAKVTSNTYSINFSIFNPMINNLDCPVAYPLDARLS